MALFVTGETAPFSALCFRIFFRRACASFRTLVPEIGMGSIGASIHRVWIYCGKFDTEDLGPLFGRESCLLAGFLAGCVLADVADALQSRVSLVVISSRVSPSIKVKGFDYQKDVLHHLVRQFTGEQRNGGTVIQCVFSLFSKASELRNERVHVSGNPGETAQFGFSAFPGGCVPERVHELVSQIG